MDFIKITEKEGYRLEDLSKENQFVINMLNYVVESVEGYEYADEDTINGTTIGKIKDEFAETLKDEIILYIKGTIAEIQVSLAESESEAEADDGN